MTEIETGDLNGDQRDDLVVTRIAFPIAHQRSRSGSTSLTERAASSMVRRCGTGRRHVQSMAARSHRRLQRRPPQRHLRRRPRVRPFHCSQVTPTRSRFRRRRGSLWTRRGTCRRNRASATRPRRRMSTVTARSISMSATSVPVPIEAFPRFSSTTAQVISRERQARFPEKSPAPLIRDTHARCSSTPIATERRISCWAHFEARIRWCC